MAKFLSLQGAACWPISFRASDSQYRDLREQSLLVETRLALE